VAVWGSFSKLLSKLLLPTPVFESLETIHAALTHCQSRSLSHCTLTGPDLNLTCYILTNLSRMATSLLSNWFNISLQASHVVRSGSWADLELWACQDPLTLRLQ